MLTAIFLPLLACPFLAWIGKVAPRRVGYLTLLLPVVSTLSLLAVALQAGPQAQVVLEYPWVPSLGINLSLLVDGLSLFFGLVVSGMGILIVFYARHYLADHYAHQGRFYCYLMLFMAAMLGTVFANNLMLLFVFWELTGLASFFLIGFTHGEKASRAGARMALLITAGTGLLLMAGLIMLYTLTGHHSFAELAAQGLPAGEHRDWVNVAFLLIMLGAFGKSAQFPLHFWLPSAMAAPTPVSAYLHSATMVKLGVFLSARIFPLFVESEWWAPLLATICFSTLALTSVLALLSHDLKAILAFSTVSQLGFLIGYYGLGAAEGVEYDYLHILNHVFYKGCLFMVVGIVAHSAGQRDLRQLGGLWRRLPLLGATTLLACAAMAGLPGTTGFISKELMFKEIFTAMEIHDELGAYAIGCVVLSSMVKVAFSARLFYHIFLGPEPARVAKHFQAPSLAIQLPPLALALAAVGFGLFPALLERPLHYLAVAGLHTPTPMHLTLWHGVNRELLASTAVVALGFGVFWVGKQTQWRWATIPGWLRFDDFFERGLLAFSHGAKRLTRALGADYPPAYLPIIVAFFVAMVGGSLLVTLWPEEPLRAGARLFAAGQLDTLRTFVAGLIALAVLGVIVLKRWTTQIISLSVAGFLITFYFVLYRAPDLAMTQILVESATLILLLLLLARFPRSAEEGEMADVAWTPRKFFSVAAAVGVGGTITTLIMLMTATPAPAPIGHFFLEQTVPLAGGSNAVNTILVDFRGLDTLGEITVLFIAMLGGLGLLMRYKRTPKERELGPLGQPGYGIHQEPESHDEPT